MLRRSESTTAQARAPSRSAIAKIVRKRAALARQAVVRRHDLVRRASSGCETRIAAGRADVRGGDDLGGAVASSRRRSSRSPPAVPGSAWPGRPTAARTTWPIVRALLKLGMPTTSSAVPSSLRRSAHPRLERERSRRPPAAAARPRAAASTAAVQPAGPGAGARSVAAETRGERGVERAVGARHHDRARSTASSSGGRSRRRRGRRPRRRRRRASAQHQRAHGLPLVRPAR